MDSSLAALGRHGARPLSRSIVVGGLLAAAVFIGLLTMHGHGSPGVIAAHTSSPDAVMTHAAMVDDALRQAPTDDSCAGCFERGAGTMMGCLLVLLATVAILVAHGQYATSVRRDVGHVSLPWPTLVELQRPPSLIMLGICRR